jgi:hypothetical protein
MAAATFETTDGKGDGMQATSHQSLTNVAISIFYREP